MEVTSSQWFGIGIVVGMLWMLFLVHLGDWLLKKWITKKES